MTEFSNSGEKGGQISYSILERAIAIKASSLHLIDGSVFVETSSEQPHLQVSEADYMALVAALKNLPFDNSRQAPANILLPAEMHDEWHLRAHIGKRCFVIDIFNVHPPELQELMARMRASVTSTSQS